ncbi:MAG: 6-carboxytetrahydropterin synthase QueD [Thermacetogeniaceae bacterium]
MGCFELRVNTTFDAAHYLRNYEGKCSRLHGHTWKVEVAVAGTEVDERGMVIDFLDIKGILREITGGFDHTLLNDVPPFCGGEGKGLNPTAENLARLIFEELEKKLKEVAPAVYPVAVQVWESDSSSVIYRGSRGRDAAT